MTDTNPEYTPEDIVFTARIALVAALAVWMGQPLEVRETFAAKVKAKMSIEQITEQVTSLVELVGYDVEVPPKVVVNPHVKPDTMTAGGAVHTGMYL